MEAQAEIDQKIQVPQSVKEDNDHMKEIVAKKTKKKEAYIDLTHLPYFHMGS